MSNNDIGTAISKYRYSIKLSQSEFAQLISVSQSTVAAWENGKSIPKGLILDKIKEIITKTKTQVVGTTELMEEIKNLKQELRIRDELIEFMRSK